MTSLASDWVLGVVPAAGLSTRMGGSPKPLLETGSGTFLQRIVTCLRGGGVDRVWVGVRELGGPIAAEARRWGAQAFLPVDPDDGPISSLRTAIRNAGGEAPPPSAIVWHPADLPLVRPATVEELIGAWRRSHPPLVLPAMTGRTGHPVLFDRSIWDELLRADLPQGARSVVDAHRAEALQVEVSDPGIHLDIDTLPEYRRQFPDAFRKRFQKW
jgi:molybdenum cofactor cytidylyltransferase